MKTEDLESLLEAGEETPTFEVKGPMNWDPVSLAKDILAMSNVRDGGTILIGVEDGTFARVGVSAEIKATYDIDRMRDQISPFADPSVSFGVTFPRDRGGLEYVAIEVRPFRDIPTVCARDANGLQKGTIYYRSESRRPQSARVSNSSDMRDIIETAIARRGQRLRQLGFTSESDLESKLADEREGL